MNSFLSACGPLVVINSVVVRYAMHWLLVVINSVAVICETLCVNINF